MSSGRKSPRKSPRLGKKKTFTNAKMPTITTTSITETVSSLATVEKVENDESVQKMAGMGFNFG